MSDSAVKGRRTIRVSERVEHKACWLKFFGDPPPLIHSLTRSFGSATVRSSKADVARQDWMCLSTPPVALSPSGARRQGTSLRRSSYARLARNARRRRTWLDRASDRHEVITCDRIFLLSRLVALLRTSPWGLLRGLVYVESRKKSVCVSLTSYLSRSCWAPQDSRRRSMQDGRVADALCSGKSWTLL